MEYHIFIANQIQINTDSVIIFRTAAAIFPGKSPQYR